ncbi:hypothetical protein DQ238_19250 [Geodermatophilus sp. TF02-6]|uniref:hypothetical protein n=1 Tax=Geodermatophilus sp. TF02-6 TaxID=2250575 RepID=UPI000DEB0C6C|nr:hypothetical protein [Geodermatophilus sp. TF02-6]RBY75760.1 hypothetical protein DQ238_19250 [Geodermatophilus sp. TF02-6]
MPTPTPFRRPQVQRLGLVGIGAAVLLVGIASSAGAATGVSIPLEPTAVVLSAVPVDSLGSMDPMADPTSTVYEPTPVQYGGTITVDIPAELDDSAVGAELVFDDNGDGIPEATYSSSFTPANPNFLVVAGQGTGSITVTLPADDPIAGDAATLTLEPLPSTLSPAFTSYDQVVYELGFDASAPAAQTVQPQLVALSQVPCDVYSGTRCPFPTPVTAGSTVTLDLTDGSVLRELGITDLTDVQVGLQQLDADGLPTGAAPVELAVQVDGETASFVLPAGTAAGSYGLVVVQQTPSGGISVFSVELTVVAEESPAVVPPAVPPTAAPPAATTTQPVVVNAGLRSNTGVEVVETGSTGTVTVATGAGLLLLAGLGGAAVVRTRRRPATEGGTCAD